MPTRTTGHFTCADWKERALVSDGTSPGLAHASVTNGFTGGIDAPGTTCAYTIAYRADKTGAFTGMELLAGRLDGREGAFVVEERGSFTADGTVHCAFDVVPGSGTGDLTGLRGSGRFTARHGETSVPYTFDYELDSGTAPASPAER
ncbi:DUF3224 domain-containing protein [Streptomyces sp. NPDC047821]|uniref:DUF3224 domain-containing protein n=1 Tax=Streptomyces sp. NPDC047821 TaxID=3365488 RepID=UPI003713ADDD